MDKKYSIIMPYYKRAGQLHNTLMSFIHFYGGRTDVEIIIIEDEKNIEDALEHVKLLKLIDNFDIEGNGVLDINLLCSKKGGSFNPSPLFNEGAAEAQGKYIIITNPECIHMVNILKGMDREFAINPDAYIVCACESSAGNNEYIQAFSDFYYSHHMWYQHSLHRNEMYHFCTAIRKVNYKMIGGFDEDFAHGVGYDDNMFRDMVISSGFEPVLCDDLLTVHCKHERHHTRQVDYKAQLERNKKLYEDKRRGLCLLKK